MRRSGRWLLILAAAASGCGPFRALPDPFPVNQLAIRAIQTRSYTGQEVRSVVKTLLAVLQDDGFLVHYGDLELGLLDASKMEAGVPDGVFGLGLGTRVRAAVTGAAPFIVVTDATANVSRLGDRVEVRVNFQRRITDGLGHVLGGVVVTDAKRYQEFFAKLDKGLFLTGQGL